jgi:putative copper resistance protein D
MTTKQLIKAPSAIVLILLGSAVGLVVGMFLGGSATAVSLADTGPLLRWLTPTLRILMDVSQGIAIGGLVLIGFALTAKTPAFRKSLNLVAISAAIWALSGTAYLIVTYLNISGSTFSLDQSFADQFYIFVTSIELGKYLALNLLAGFVLAIITLFVRNYLGVLFSGAIALAALIPIALSGHSAGSANHALAVNSLGLHLLGISIWVGGLVTLIVAYRNDARKEIVTRYSSLALFSFTLVLVSGSTAAQIRLGDISNWFTTSYGQVALLKVLALAVLGVFGFIYRTKLIKDLTDKFWKLISFEFNIFGLAIGLGTALARTAYPIVDYPSGELTPAEILTGSKLPAEPNVLSLFLSWKIDVLWSLICLALVLFYILGVRRLRSRGDEWSIARTLSWVSGVFLMFYITNGYFNVYEQYLFSSHMLSHMLLTMGVPVLLVPGAPVTLLARATVKRKDDSRGIREWVLWAVHTKYAQLIAHPLVAAILFASSLIVFYFTPLFAWATKEHLGHQWMIVHFVITGYLFIQALVGIDPGPKRFGYPQRVILLIGTLAFHAFFGLALMNGQTLLLPEWFGAMGRTWGAPPLEDQQTGGAIAWGIGELPTAILILLVSVNWSRSDQREAKRLDRASDRSGNQDLADYNEWLARINKGK